MDIDKGNPEQLLEAVKEEQAKEERKKKLNSFIWDGKEVLQRKAFPMDLHNDIFYFGLLLPKWVDVEVKGKKYGKRQTLSPVLITSKKELLEIDEVLKGELRMDFETIPSYLPVRWELEKIKNFLDKKTEIIKGEELLNEIVKIYEKYLFIRNKTWYKILAVWDMGTYFYQIFEAFPIIENRGLPGTAKSKSMGISSYLAFNGGQLMLNPSEATLFRETDEVRGSKYIDEAEKLFMFNPKTKQFEGDSRAELINGSYTKEAKVPRQEKIGNKFVTKWYSPYSPTQVSSINGLHGATETRAITRICTKSPNNDVRGELEPSEDKNLLIWSEIRDKCYRFTLENWKEIKEIYNHFPKDCGLKRRDFQIWKPLLAILKYVSEEDYQEVLNFAIDLTARRVADSIPESSFDYAVLKALKKVISDNPLSEKIYVDEIKLIYCNQKGIPVKDEKGKEDVYLNRNISNHLDNLGFKELRKRDKNKSYFAITRAIFDEVVSPQCPELSFLSTSSTSSTSLSLNLQKKGGDGVVIDVDKEKEKVVMVAINGDDVDGYQEKEAEEVDFSQLNFEDSDNE